MAIFEIITYPDDRLKQPTKQVHEVDEDILKIIENMAETMYAAPGAGLAANQIGIDKSIIVYDAHPGEDKKALNVLINPVITCAEGSRLSEDEGCLSVPDYRSDVKRYASIVVEGLDQKGRPIRIESDDFLAVVLQHEIDHLNGILFIDRISRLKCELYKKRIKKQMKKQNAV